MRQIVKGATDQSTIIRIVDSTDGTPETGVTSATSGLDLSYRREGGSVVGLTVSDLASADAAHTDGGIIHIGAGYYRVDLPDAACATGADGVLVFGSVTGMVVIGSYHELVDAKQTGDAYARLGAPAGASIAADIAAIEAQTDDIGTAGAGLTAIPWNSAWDAEVQSEVADALTAFGVSTFDASTDTVNANVTQISGDSTAADNLEAMLDGTGNVTITADISGDLSGSVGSVTAPVDLATGAIDDAALGTITEALPANVKRINDTDITGDGSTVTPWGPAS